MKLSELRRKLTDIRKYVNSMVLEREAETDSAIVSILSGQSCLFIGDAGAGKTYHIELLCELLGLTLFDTLISQATKPDAIFGPPDIPALANGIQRWKTTGYAPTADIVFFDEIFKANDVVLNPLLWFLNEHKFRNGDEGIIDCPLITTFAASNEVPTAKSDRPIYDRFLIRHDVRYIQSNKNMHKLLDLVQRQTEIEKPTPLTKTEIGVMKRLAQKVKFNHELWDVVIKIRDQVQNGVGVVISDRRLGKTVNVLKANAFLNNRNEVEEHDLEILANMFWDVPEQARKVRTIVLANSNVEKGDLLSYTETANSIYEKAVKTGDFDGALLKLRELGKTTRQFVDSTTGREVHRAVVAHYRTVKNVLENRKTIIVYRMTEGTEPFLKLSASCSDVWTSDQLRSVGFKWKRSLGYWWKPLKGKTAYSAFTNLVAKKLKASVEQKGII